MIDGDLFPAPIEELLAAAPALPVMIGLTTLECGLLSEFNI